MIGPARGRLVAMATMETLTEAMERLRDAGYGSELSATPDGMLECTVCAEAVDPATVNIDETVRFEGPSDPGDESILFALSSESGHLGFYNSAYGPETPAADVKVMRALIGR